MRFRAAFVAVLAAVAAACAAPVQRVEVQPAQTPAAFDPVGVYDMVTAFQGTSIPGVLVIQRRDAGLGGSLTTELSGELPLSRVAFEGRRGELRAPTPQGDMIMRIEFIDDDRFQGGWELVGTASGGVSGQRRR
jgi:hypothetical protein